ncbi:MAG: hypothetical protein COW65_00680 [Cytophagales bacterium CG18_big_fil_WC_8_21_14_2_50_42_9]|nr:MAG: hypothetical protein COW65_00680 [Cytophagales bacterium CG18_big_fil_WC_8_21_14_2_50_42_9]
MKSLKYAVAALAFISQFGAQAQANELELFLKKFESYAETYYPKVKWKMPIAKPESGSYSMLQGGGIVEAFMEDTKTGLRYYSSVNKVYDPLTGYYIDYDRDAKYRVDTREGKIYKGNSEVEIKNTKAK